MQLKIDLLVANIPVSLEHEGLLIEKAGGAGILEVVAICLRIPQNRHPPAFLFRNS